MFLIYLYGIRLKNIPNTIFKFLYLEELELSSNHISKIPTEIAQLTSLKGLGLSFNKITEIPIEVCRLNKLRKLSLHDNKISVVPQQITNLSAEFGRTPSNEGIILDYNPIEVPPIEIVNQGKEAIFNCYNEREKEDICHLHEAKMLILGEGRAGKTILLRRLYQPKKSLPSEKETTKGIDIYRHKFIMRNGHTFRLNVWDFGGQEIYHATHQFFLTRRSLYLLVDDTSKNNKSVSDEGFKYWLELIDVFSEHSPVLIFQNEKGGRTKAIDIRGIKGRFDNVKERPGT